jgi:hypothetical protein
VAAEQGSHRSFNGKSASCLSAAILSEPYALHLDFQTGPSMTTAQSTLHFSQKHNAHERKAGCALSIRFSMTAIGAARLGILNERLPLNLAAVQSASYQWRKTKSE